MINEAISFDLPQPWDSKKFEIDNIGIINFLVGPNGSGKSRFADELYRQLKQRPGGARLLGTDRLSGMESSTPLVDIVGDTFGRGFDENRFANLKTAGTERGSGIDTFVLLEERLDLHIQIEATLSHLFERDISLKWASGRLMPMVERRQDGVPYRLDRDECHGIKELLVLLTHLYDEKVRFLIVDEPELNLHPQYQAFFMQEVRKITDDPMAGSQGKAVFLITHSPFILDFRSEDDLNSTILFDRMYSPPRQVAGLNLDFSSMTSSIGRLNAHHMQLFFSDNPIFVEGPHDALIVEALLEARGVSVAGAGSCIIDAGGVDQVNHYLQLCLGLRKQAHFIYDLDSLFRGKLRSCIRDDQSIDGFLASVGLGSEFAKAFSLLERDLRELIDNLPSTGLPAKLDGFQKALSRLGDRKAWNHDGWSKARVMVLTAISLYREDVISVTDSKTVEGIEGRRDQILASLRSRNIQVLPGGSLERYLPRFEGDVYAPSQKSKQVALEAELSEIHELQMHTGINREEEMGKRYGELYATICRLPSKTEADIDVVLRRHLSDYIHELQKAVKDNPEWHQEDLNERLSDLPMSKGSVVVLQKFERTGPSKFEARIGINAIQRQGSRTLKVTEQTTIANMGELEPDPTYPRGTWGDSAP